MGGRRYLDYVKKKCCGTTILAFVDNNPKIIGTSIEAIPVIAPGEIGNYSYDKIVIATMIKYTEEIFNQLSGMGIPETKIESAIYTDAYGYDAEDDRRTAWLRDFARHVYMYNIAGNTAECGVFRGHFAHYINRYLRDRKLYLFDTFDSFAEQDFDFELNLGNDFFKHGFFGQNKDIFKATRAEWIMRSMPFPENCIIKKGIFPETATDVHDTFCFVNLDMDLYRPTLAALEFFWEKVSTGGIILVHDYYHPELPGVAKSVEDFEKSIGKIIGKTPIGDSCSIALIKC